MLSTRLKPACGGFVRSTHGSPNVAPPGSLLAHDRKSVAMRFTSSYASPDSQLVKPAIDQMQEHSNGHAALIDPQTVHITMPDPKPCVLPAYQNYQNVVSMGTSKATMPAGKIFLLGIVAGCYIAFGSFLMLTIAGAMPGLASSNPGLYKLCYALVFPVGLLMVILGGAELYTGNTMTVMSAFLEGKITRNDLAKSWFCSYSGNLVGSLLMVAAVASTGMLTDNIMAAKMATAKTSLPFGVAVMRAVLANWLVCVAVFHAAAASSLTGKLLGLWAPITTFVAIGLEHSVANMFIIPMGMVLGGNISVVDFLFKNLIPVTIGNTFAGVVCMALMYAMCYGSLGKTLFPPVRV